MAKTRIFILSLPRCRDRRLKALAQIQATGLDFELVDGVDAAMLKPELLAVPGDAWRLTTGEVACYLSHLGLLQRVCDYGLDHAIILEDDFRITGAANMSLETLWNHLPEDADHVQLHNLRQHLYEPYRITEAGEFFNKVSPTNPCTWAHIVSRRFAAFVLEHFSVPRMPIDHLYIQLSLHCPQFGFYDTTERVVDATWDMPSILDRETAAERVV